MATEAAWLERKESTGRKERENRKRNTLLTHAGLLMEGVERRLPFGSWSNGKIPEEIT
jgi:hypothetical protein